MSFFPLEPIETASVDDASCFAAQAPAVNAAPRFPELTGVPGQVRRSRRAAARLQDAGRSGEVSLHHQKRLARQLPVGMFAVPREKCARILASSGTTGKPTVVSYTLKDIAAGSIVVACSIRASGARPGDMVYVSYGYGLFTGGLGAHCGAEKLGLTLVPFGGGQSERQVQLMQNFRPGVVLTPSPACGRGRG